MSRTIRLLVGAITPNYIQWKIASPASVTRCDDKTSVQLASGSYTANRRHFPPYTQCYFEAKVLRMIAAKVRSFGKFRMMPLLSPTDPIGVAYTSVSIIPSSFAEPQIQKRPQTHVDLI
jgi:hypothetical protein